MHGKQKAQDWKLFKNVWISTEPVLPGVWERKEGPRRASSCHGQHDGQDPRHLQGTPDGHGSGVASVAREGAGASARGAVSAESPRTRFAEFAEALVEQKKAVGEIKKRQG